MNIIRFWYASVANATVKCWSILRTSVVKFLLTVNVLVGIPTLAHKYLQLPVHTSWILLLDILSGVLEFSLQLLWKGCAQAFLTMLTKILKNQLDLIFSSRTIHNFHSFRECSFYAYVSFFRWLALSNENYIPSSCETIRESVLFVSDSGCRHCGRHLEISQSHTRSDSSFF